MHILQNYKKNPSNLRYEGFIVVTCKVGSKKGNPFEVPFFFEMKFLFTSGIIC